MTAQRIINACITSLILGVVTFGVGGLWTWWLPEPRRSGSRWIAVTVASARALVAGVVITGLVALVLGLAGCYSPGWEALALAILLGAGHLLGMYLAGERFRRTLVYCWPGAVFITFASAAILLCPIRSEWIAGGWDPGVYVNESVALAEQGTFEPSDEFFHDELAPEEQPPFTRSGKGRTERFPGVAVNNAGRSFEFEFFRLFPAVTARLHRAGGIEATVRVNMILGLFVLIAFTGMMLELARPSIALGAVLVLLFQPILLYHMHVPVTEMLQLLIVCGVGLLLPWRSHGRSGAPAVAIMLAAGVLTHFSFLPIGALLLCCIAWIDLSRSDRRRVMREHVWMLVGLAAGWAVDMAVAPVSFMGWEEGLAPVALAGVGLGFAALALDVVAMHARAKKWLARPPALVRWPVACGLGIFLLVSLYRGCRLPGDEDAITFVRLLHYLGWVPLALGIAGGLSVFSDESRIGREARGLILFWGGLALLMLLRINDWTVPYYPWALRRYLVCAVPFVAVGSSVFFVTLWRSGRGEGWSRRAAAAILAVALAGTVAPKCRRACTRTEHNGIIVALKDVADQIGQDDIVVVDHPAWGMPLALVHGKQVLNARHFYRRGRETATAGMSVLWRLARQGRRVRFLTCTEAGMGVYPVRLRGVRQDWASPPFKHRVIAHHRLASDFVLRERTKVFRLHSLIVPQVFGPVRTD